MADETQTPNAPQSTEGLTPAELRYFSSGGADVPGEREAAPPAAEAAQPQAATPDAQQPPAPAAEQPAQQPQQDQRQVNKGALDEERNRRRAAERALESLNQRFAALEARLAPQPQQQQPQGLPPVDEDPVATVKYLRGVVEQHQQAQAEEVQIVGVLQQSDRLEKEYAESVPDYDAALDYLRNQLLAEAQISGVPHPVAMQHIKRQAAQTAALAMQQGKNPGEVFYAYARARGWNGQQQAPATPALQTPPAAPAAPQQPQTAAHAALAMLQQGQAASQSLTAAPGRTPEGATLQDIASLEGDDFLNAWTRAEKIQRAARA